MEFPVGDVTRLLSHSGYNGNKNITIFVTSWGAKSDEQDRDNIVYVLAQAYKKRGTDNFIVSTASFDFRFLNPFSITLPNFKTLL